MMDEQGKFWVAVWTIVAFVLVLTLAVVTGYYKDRNKLATEMVLAGQDPITVKCMLEDSYGDNPVCVAIVTKRAGGE